MVLGGHQSNWAKNASSLAGNHASCEPVQLKMGKARFLRHLRIDEMYGGDAESTALRESAIRLGAFWKNLVFESQLLDESVQDLRSLDHPGIRPVLGLTLIKAVLINKVDVQSRPHQSKAFFTSCAHPQRPFWRTIVAPRNAHPHGHPQRPFWRI